MNIDKELLPTYSRQELLKIRQDIALELFQTDAHNTSEKCRNNLYFIDAELKKRKHDYTFRGINRYGEKK